MPKKPQNLQISKLNMSTAVLPLCGICPEIIYYILAIIYIINCHWSQHYKL